MLLAILNFIFLAFRVVGIGLAILFTLLFANASTRPFLFLALIRIFLAIFLFTFFTLFIGRIVLTVFFALFIVLTSARSLLTFIRISLAILVLTFDALFIFGVSLTEF